MSALTELMEHHTITLVSGVPDYYKIRLLETEFHGEPITPYPGTHWVEMSKDDHYRRHQRHQRYSHNGADDCLWCEDDRHRREVISAKVEAAFVAEQDATYRKAHPRRRLRISGPVMVMIAGWFIMMGLITVGVVWG